MECKRYKPFPKLPEDTEIPNGILTHLGAILLVAELKLHEWIGQAVAVHRKEVDAFNQRYGHSGHPVGLFESTTDVHSAPKAPLKDRRLCVIWHHGSPEVLSQFREKHECRGRETEGGRVEALENSAFICYPTNESEFESTCPHPVTKATNTKVKLRTDGE